MGDHEKMEKLPDLLDGMLPVENNNKNPEPYWWDWDDPDSDPICICPTPETCVRFKPVAKKPKLASTPQQAQSHPDLLQASPPPFSSMRSEHIKDENEALDTSKKLAQDHPMKESNDAKYYDATNERETEIKKKKRL